MHSKLTSILGAVAVLMSSSAVAQQKETARHPEAEEVEQQHEKDSTGDGAMDTADRTAVLIALAEIKWAEANEIAAEQQLDLGSELTTFFDAARAGNVEAAVTAYKRALERRQSRELKIDHPLNTELYQLLIETGDLFAHPAATSYPLLRRFAEDILASLPEGSIYFGGTDPGRFAVSAFLDVSGKPNRYLMTQNALADNTYMNLLRHRLSDDLWIPEQKDSNAAFKQYVEDVRAGRLAAGAELDMEDGRVTVQGVQGVMMINGMIARQVFDHNKDKHPFFVEESYVIPWMYPYLEPHGLILKLNPHPLQSLSDEAVQRDKAFWDAYTESLLSDKRFLNDEWSRKAFSKLRSAIGGLYTYRRMFNEAEQAFRQSIELYPTSLEANFRLADAFLLQRRFSDARAVVESLLKLYPDEKVQTYLSQIKESERSDQRRRVLEEEIQRGAGVDIALELLGIYGRLNMATQFDNLVSTMLNHDDLSDPHLRSIAQSTMSAGRIDAHQKVREEVQAKRDVTSDSQWLEWLSEPETRD